MLQIKRHLTADRLCYLAIGLSLVFFGHDRILEPAFWTETTLYLSPLFTLYQDLTGYFHQPISTIYRPPGLHFLYLPFLWVLGPELYFVRILNLLYVGIGLCLFYRILKNENPFLALLSVLIILLTPIIQVYSSLYIGGPQLFFLMALYLWVLVFYPEKKILLFFLGIFLGLCREITALSLIPATFAYLLASKEKNWKNYLFIWGPLLGSSLYWAFTYIKTEGAFHHMILGYGNVDLLRNPVERMLKFREFFLVPYRMLPVFFVGMLAIIFKKRWRPTPFTILCGVLTLVFAFVFSGHLRATPRFYLPVFPFALWFCLQPLIELSRGKLSKVFVTVVVILPLLMIGNPNRIGRTPFVHLTGFHDTWEYRRVQRLHVLAMKDIIQNYPQGAVVMASWPFSELFETPHVGYGDLSKFHLTTNPDDAPEVIMFANFPNFIPDEHLKQMLKQADYSLTEYQYQSYVLSLYRKKSPLGGR